MQTLTLGDFLVIAQAVTGIDADVLGNSPRTVELAESALAAPFAGYGGSDLFPTLTQKAGVLCSRLAQNHPLPDGNKRTAFLAASEFLERNEAQAVFVCDELQDRVAEAIIALSAGDIREPAFINTFGGFVWPRENTQRPRAPAKDWRSVVMHESGAAFNFRVLSDGKTIRAFAGTDNPRLNNRTYVDNDLGDLHIVYEYEADVTAIRVVEKEGQGRSLSWLFQFNTGMRGSLSIWLDAINLSDLLSDNTIQEAGDLWKVRMRKSDWIPRRFLSKHYRRQFTGDALYDLAGWQEGPESVLKLGQTIVTSRPDRYEDWWLCLDAARWLELVTLAAEAVGHPWFDVIRGVKYDAPMR